MWTAELSHAPSACLMSRVIFIYAPSWLLSTGICVMALAVLSKLSCILLGSIVSHLVHVQHVLLFKPVQGSKIKKKIVMTEHHQP